MSDQDKTPKQAVAPEHSMLRTILWIGAGILIYVGIQWLLPKVGISS